jgi:predicted DsbA family dithiol-disulfide isomerase
MAVVCNPLARAQGPPHGRPMASAPIQLELFADVVCPWCYIGAVRLARALAAPGAPAARLRWRAFELQPSLPPEGVEARPFYEKKFGGKARVDAIFARTTEVARGDGLTLRFDLMRRAPNSRLAHRAILLAQEDGAGEAAAMACLRGHFEEGADLGDRDALLDLLARHGVPVDVAALRERLAAGAAREQVIADEREAAQLGVTAVPFFVANRRLAVSGAQPPAVLGELLAEAAA